MIIREEDIFLRGGGAGMDVSEQLSLAQFMHTLNLRAFVSLVASSCFTVALPFLSACQSHSR